MKTTLIALLLVTASNAVSLTHSPYSGTQDSAMSGKTGPDRGAGEHADHNRAAGTVYDNGKSLHPNPPYTDVYHTSVSGHVFQDDDHKINP